MSVRGKREIKSRNIDEPPLLNNIKSIIDLANQNGFIVGGIVDIKSIVQREGINVLEEEMPSSVSGYLKCIDGKWLIGVNKLHNIRRKRFTIAHEYAHYILHKDQSRYFEDITFFRKDTNSTIEYKANEFAAELLMPENIVRAAIENGINGLDDLAEYFNVSILAVTFRVKELGYTIKSE